MGVEAVVSGVRQFVPKPRGGRSEMLKSGEPVHAMQGQCIGADAERWARRRGQVTFKATFSEHGAEPSTILARAWCHRMHFFCLEQAAPDGIEFVFTAELIAAYEEPTELAALEADVTNAKWPKWQPRIALIRNIPRN